MAQVTGLTADTSVFLVVDVQEKLMTKIPRARELERNLDFLLEAAGLLDVEVACTEQYPKGLGSTVPSLIDKLPHRPSKTRFSCAGVAGLFEGFRTRGRTSILVAGIETHVCVLNTVLDLLREDFAVFVPVDAVASRYDLDHQTALRRLERSGAILTTCETAVFEWLGDAAHPGFKRVSALIQDRMKTL